MCLIRLAACPHSADVVFALDASGSIEQENFYIIQEFVRDIIYGINVEGGSRVGILTYASEAEVCVGSFASTLFNLLCGFCGMHPIWITSNRWRSI